MCGTTLDERPSQSILFCVDCRLDRVLVLIAYVLCNFNRSGNIRQARIVQLYYLIVSSPSIPPTPHPPLSPSVLVCPPCYSTLHLPLDSFVLQAFVQLYSSVPHPPETLVVEYFCDKEKTHLFFNETKPLIVSVYACIFLHCHASAYMQCT